MVPAGSHASLFHLCSRVHTLLLVFSHASLFQCLVCLSLLLFLACYCFWGNQLQSIVHHHHKLIHAQFEKSYQIQCLLSKSSVSLEMAC